MRLIKTYSEKISRYDGPKRQKRLIHLYRSYLKCLRKHGVSEAMKEFRNKEDLDYGSTKEKQFYLLKKFFSLAEEQFLTLNFDQDNYTSYLLRRINKEIDSSHLNVAI